MKGKWQAKGGDAMLSRDKRLTALAWAAAQAGQSYGRFTVNMTHQDKVKIYKQYQTYLEKREAQQAAENPAAPPKDPPRKRGRKPKALSAQT
jgi:hypothetical protein